MPNSGKTGLSLGNQNPETQYEASQKFAISAPLSTLPISPYLPLGFALDPPLRFCAWERLQQPSAALSPWPIVLSVRLQFWHEQQHSSSAVLAVPLCCSTRSTPQSRYPERSLVVPPCRVQPSTARLCPCVPLRARIVADTANYVALCIG